MCLQPMALCACRFIGAFLGDHIHPNPRLGWLLLSDLIMQVGCT